MKVIHINRKITEYLVSRLNKQIDNPGYILEIEEVIKPPYQVYVAISFKSILERYKDEEPIMVGAAFLNPCLSVEELWVNNIITQEKYFNLIGKIVVSDKQVNELYENLNNKLIYHLQNKDSHLNICLNEIGNNISTEYGYCRIAYVPDESYAHIHDLYVFPEHRNQGKAKEILLKAIECIKTNGYDEIQIVCNPTEEGIDKDRLRKLYESYGLKIFEYYG
jgi:GNAT superfamily N-acetyltransferase